jgi:ABC-2 type transport system permease protein
MTSFKTLMRREWLQHRFGWALLAGVPLAIILPLLTVGQVDFGEDTAVHMADSMPLFITAASLVVTVAILVGILWSASLIQMSGLARRDHADRSNEFWLSLPTGDATSLAAPLLVHLVLVPMAAVLVGLAGGLLVSVVLVTRVIDLASWFTLPWGTLLVAALAGVARLAVGIPLAMLWLAPLIMLTVLAGAWFKRWAVPVLLIAFGLAGLLFERLLGLPLVDAWAGRLFQMAGRALLATGGHGLSVEGQADLLHALRAAPGWAAGDVLRALAELAQPVFGFGLLVSAACFAVLMWWRRRV